jgi:hypothetical protein
MFCRLKDFRRIATRYDRPATDFPKHPIGPKNRASPSTLAQLRPEESFLG